MGKYEEFLKERKYYLNVSQRTIGWHQQSLRWLGVEEPTEKQLKDCIIRMREAGLSRVQLQPLSGLAWQRASSPQTQRRGVAARHLYPGGHQQVRCLEPKSRSGHRTKLLVLTLGDTGLPLGEALNLRWPDVDLDTWTTAC